MVKLRKQAQVLQGEAHSLAFKIAQSLERTLVNRALSLAAAEGADSGNITITTQHIRAALEADLLLEACATIGVPLHGKAKAESSKSRLSA